MPHRPGSTGETSPSPGFRCLTTLGPGSVQVSLAGDLDLAGLPLFELTLRQAATLGPAVVVDLRRLGFIDHAGIQALLRAGRRICETGGQMTVVRGGAMVSWFFELSGLEDELDFVDRPPTRTMSYDVRPL